MLPLRIWDNDLNTKEVLSVTPAAQDGPRRRRYMYIASSDCDFSRMALRRLSRFACGDNTSVFASSAGSDVCEPLRGATSASAYAALRLSSSPLSARRQYCPLASAGLVSLLLLLLLLPCPLSDSSLPMCVMRVSREAMLSVDVWSWSDETRDSQAWRIVVDTDRRRHGSPQGGATIAVVPMSSSALPDKLTSSSRESFGGRFSGDTLALYFSWASRS